MISFNFDVKMVHVIWDRALVMDVHKGCKVTCILNTKVRFMVKDDW